MSEHTYILPVKGVGNFTFRKREFIDEFRVNAEIKRLSEGLPKQSDNFMDMFIDAFAALKVLTVEGPRGWDLEALDPYDEDSYAKVTAAWSALRDKEATFRPQGGGAGGATQGEGVGGDVPGVVSTDLQPSDH